MQMGDNPAARRKGGLSRIVPISLIHISSAPAMAKNALQRTVLHRGSTVRAIDHLRGTVRNGQSCLAAQLRRYALAFNLI